MKRHIYLFVFVALVTAVMIPSRAFADLISVTSIPVSTDNLGSPNALLSIHHNGQSSGTESGCINANGTFSPCLNNGTTHVLGGDNTGTNQLITFPSNQSFAAVVGVKGSGQNTDGWLTDLYLTFTGSNGTFTTEYLGPDILLSSGNILFALSDTDVTHAQSLGSTVTISGGLSFTTGNAGPETLWVVPYQTPSTQALAAVPEPRTLVLMGSGMLILALLRTSSYLTGRRKLARW